MPVQSTHFIHLNTAHPPREEPGFGAGSEQVHDSDVQEPDRDQFTSEPGQKKVTWLQNLIAKIRRRKRV